MTRGVDVAASEGAVEAGEAWTVLRLMLWSSDYLGRKGVERARLDAEYLLAHVLGVGRLDMYLQHERVLGASELDAFRPLLRRRANREPLQYILGRQPFRELDLEVGPGVLIPRPETERLVEVVLDWAAKRSGEGMSALDVGTGSGAIALSLVTEGPFERVVGSDSSAVALAIAGRNRDALGVGRRLELRRGAYFDPLGADELFDVIVSNPPYVAESRKDDLPPEVASWEPADALFAGPDGLDALREVVRGAPSHLHPEGLLALEVGDGQAEEVATLIRGGSQYREIEIHRDLAGKQRFVTGTRAA